MVVSYTNNYGYTDALSRQQVSNFATNADGGGNGGGGAFLKMFEEREAEDMKNGEKEVSSAEGSHNPLDDLYKMNSEYYASPNVLNDYINNSLLLNTEQVACSNITQHLALKSSVQDTLKFLNTQAAKDMVNSKRRRYITAPNKLKKATKPEPVPTITTDNFFETGVGTQSAMNNPNVNFFMTK